MIFEKDFKISRRPYAVDLSSFKGAWGHSYVINAVWFRRRRAGGSGELRTVACIGCLGGYQVAPPKDAADFLMNYRDGRYGGQCEGRWDGEGYWGAEKPETIEEHLAILKPMLKNYPAVPPGYEGWWRFETHKELYG